MKRGSTALLQSVVAIIGILVLIALLWFPHLEGRNVNANLFQIYFQDPFLTYVYVASTPFFFALHRAFRLLGYMEQGKAFTQKSVNALRTIKYCAVACMGFLAVAMPIMVTFAQDDDSPGVVLIVLIATFAAGVIATAAGLFQQLLQNGVNIKSENDLTV